MFALDGTDLKRVQLFRIESAFFLGHISGL